MKNNIKNRMNTGGALVILVILVVAMSLFALLAIRSSLNEKRLSLKTKESIENFYKMDAEATRIYARLDEIIAKSSDVGAELTEYKEIKEKEQKGGMSAKINDIQYNGDIPVLIKYSVEHNGKTLNVRIGVNGRETTIEKWSTKAETDNLNYEMEILD